MLGGTVEVDVQRDTIEVVIAAVGAAATLAAVLVALFANAWREARRRPALDLTADQSEISTYYAIDPDDRSLHELEPITLRLRNERGKDPARDVEIVLSVSGIVEEEASITDTPHRYPK